MHLSWSNAKVRGVAAQIMVVAFVGGILVWLGLNTAYNLQVRRIASGFAFMQRESGLPLAESLIPYSAADTYLRALLVGALNTLKVAIVGIVLATILGTLLGIARLSRNWLLSKASAVYIEIVRDLPLLLQLLFWYAILQGLPGPAQSLNPFAGVYLSNRALKLPAIVWQPAIGWGLLAAFAGLVLAALLVSWGHARHMQDGRTRAVWPLGLTLIIVPPALVWSFLGAPLAIDWPALRGFNFRGGLTVSPEYVALLLGLVLYTAGFIAEIVRAGILAVPRGQTEAAEALGLPRRLALRKIVLPQTLRMIVPPITSQYLNLTNNSSLAVAIGYQDIVYVANTTINQTGQAIEGVAIIMAVYLSISLSISLFMNWYNASVA